MSADPHFPYQVDEVTLGRARALIDILHDHGYGWTMGEMLEYLLDKETRYWERRLGIEILPIEHALPSGRTRKWRDNNGIPTVDRR